MHAVRNVQCPRLTIDEVRKHLGHHLVESDLPRDEEQRKPETVGRLEHRGGKLVEVPALLYTECGSAALGETFDELDQRGGVERLARVGMPQRESGGDQQFVRLDPRQYVRHLDDVDPQDDLLQAVSPRDQLRAGQARQGQQLSNRQLVADRCWQIMCLWSLSVGNIFHMPTVRRRRYSAASPTRLSPGGARAEAHAPPTSLPARTRGRVGERPGLRRVVQ